MASDISMIRDQVKANVLGIYARTNRDGTISATLINESLGSNQYYLSGITLDMSGNTRTITPNASDLVGRWVYSAQVSQCRRISANDAYDGTKTLITLEDDFATAPSAGESLCYLYDGFYAYAVDADLEKYPMDRHFRVQLMSVTRDPEFGNYHMGRFSVNMDIQIVYEVLPDIDRTILRAFEDAQHIQAAMLDDANQPNGGAILFVEDQAEISFQAEDESWLVLSVPVTASFTAQTVED